MPFYTGVHYLILEGTGKAVYGPATCGEIVDIINAMPKDEAARYYNASRFQLGKYRRYPNTKTGNAALAADVAAAKFQMPFLKWPEYPHCPECGAYDWHERHHEGCTFLSRAMPQGQ